jgi:hypothetical protein|tara:strand:- start:2798 stop:4657 length:1860 start_codon:yes stop_codon:yes gene_type:complete
MAETTPKKKNLSPETEAIVARLVREGELVRNDGKHSIKEIRIDLGKFTDAFAAIKISSEQTAKVLTDSWEGNEALLKNIDESLVGLNDTEKDAELARRAQAKKDAIANKENKSESSIAAKSLKLSLMSGFKGLKDGFMAIKKDPWGSLLSIGKWAIILPVLAGAIKGLLDKMFGEGEMGKFYDRISNSPFAKIAMEYPIATLLTSLAAMAGLKWAVMYRTMMLVAGGMGVKGGGVDGVVGTGGDGDGKKGKGGRLKGLGKNVLKMAKGNLAITAITSGGLLLLSNMDDGDTTDVASEMAALDAEYSGKEKVAKDKMLTGFENDRAGISDVILGTLGGAGTGAAFGAVTGGGVGALPGAVFGALTGFFTSVGQVAYEAHQDFKHDIDEVPNELEKALKNEQKKNKLSLMYGRTEKAAELTRKTTEGMQKFVNDLRDNMTTDALFGDANIAALEAASKSEIAKTGRRGRDEYVMFGGELVNIKSINKRLEEAKETRVNRERQLKASERLLQLRTGEVESVETSIDNANNLNAQIDEVAAKAAAAKPNILPDVEARDKKQTVAAGGFALNITNNYITKGGDTMVQNKSDNRVSSQNSTNAVVVGGPGGRFSGGTGLPTGQMA